MDLGDLPFEIFGLCPVNICLCFFVVGLFLAVGCGPLRIGDSRFQLADLVIRPDLASNNAYRYQSQGRDRDVDFRFDCHSSSFR